MSHNFFQLFKYSVKYFLLKYTLNKRFYIYRSEIFHLINCVRIQLEYICELVQFLTTKLLIILHSSFSDSIHTIKAVFAYEIKRQRHLLRKIPEIRLMLNYAFKFVYIKTFKVFTKRCKKFDLLPC